MSYSEFSLDRVLKTFNLTTSEKTNLFANSAETQCSEIFIQTLEYNVPLALAINTEKARSELIIAPVLLELRRQLQDTPFPLKEYRKCYSYQTREEKINESKSKIAISKPR